MPRLLGNNCHSLPWHQLLQMPPLNNRESCWVRACTLLSLVDRLEPESAAKVTGMLLEMDQTEVLHLIESPEALQAKVGEAMEVLNSVVNQADQLANLSLN
ncbi:unnamed protein product [Rhodiola kirilowii]